MNTKELLGTVRIFTHLGIPTKGKRDMGELRFRDKLVTLCIFHQVTEEEAHYLLAEFKHANSAIGGLVQADWTCVIGL